MANKTQKKKPTKKTSLGKRLFLIVSAFLSIAIIAIGAVSIYFISSAPKVTENDLIGTTPSLIYDKNGNVITTLGGNDRTFLDSNAIPENLENALLSIEDRRFYEHSGVDVIRIMGALFANINSRSLSQGGSTITQQLIKLSVFSTTKEDQTIRRKIQEAWLSVQLEREYSKKEILAFYMNKVYLANNVYGFGTAAKYYYGKAASELSIAEAATLAGLVQAPSAYDPYRYPEEALKRRNMVLDAMLANQKITQEAYDSAKNTAIATGMLDHSGDKSVNELAIDAYIQVVLNELKEKTNLDPYTDGLNIYTHLDTDAQNHLVNVLNSTDYIRWINNDVQAAVAITNPNDGSIIAIAGGRNVTVQMGLNRAITATRSVGSTSKPLIDYGPAVEYLNYSSATVIPDSPITYSDGTPLYNWDKSYYGTMTMRQALQASRNTTALRTLRAVGTDNAYAFLAKLGINVVNNGVSGIVEANAIGFEASPLQMSSAYGAFANGGTYYKPFTISKIVTRSGETATYVGEGKRAMKDSTAYIITNILQGIPGSNNAAFSGISNLYHAGKTGTTNYTDAELDIVTGGKYVPYTTPDSWFVGFSKNYSIATWVGYDSPTTLGGYLNREEAYYPQKIYRAVMSYLAKRSTNSNWKAPNSVEQYGGEYYVKGTRPIVTTTQSETTLETTKKDETSESSLIDEIDEDSSAQTTTLKSSQSATTRNTSRTNETTSRR